MIIAITGASGVGKTTITKQLSNQTSDNLIVYHFDDIGMPDWSKLEDHKKWQKDTTIKWIDKLVKISKTKKVHIVFEGSTEIEYFLNGFSRNNYDDFVILVFDCSKDTMKERLDHRGQSDFYTPDMINWLNHLRNDAIANNIEIIETDKIPPATICQIITNKLPPNEL